MRTPDGNEPAEMIQRDRTISITLPAAKISAKMIREIDVAIPQILHSKSWLADLPQGGRISSKGVDAFLDALGDEPDIQKIHVFATSELSSHISVLCSLSYVVLQCKFDQKDDLEFSVFTDFIKGMISENQQSDLTTLGPIIRPKRPDQLTPVKELEPIPVPMHDKDKLPLWSGLNKHKITEDIISRVGAYVLIAVISLVVGYFLARL